MNKFIQGGRLTDYHKCKIKTEQLLNRLNQIAKEKVNETRREQNNIHLALKSMVKVVKNMNMIELREKKNG